MLYPLLQDDLLRLFHKKDSVLATDCCLTAPSHPSNFCQYKNDFLHLLGVSMHVAIELGGHTGFAKQRSNLAFDNLGLNLVKSLVIYVVLIKHLKLQSSKHQVMLYDVEHPDHLREDQNAMPVFLQTHEQFVQQHHLAAVSQKIL